MLPYIILEIANTHGGNKEYIFSLIDRVSKIKYQGLGIKFQVFKYDQISLPDFSWYEVYKKLYFDDKTWREILSYTKQKNLDIWIDIFDRYSVSVIEKNIDKIDGIKLQASVLNNYEIITLLRALDLKDKKIIINVSGYELSIIENFLNKFSAFNAKELIIQIGFQHYPTSISDTSLTKIKIIQQAFPSYKICYADHIDANDEFSIEFPALAFNSGAQLIEKHVCLDRVTAAYDGFSSLNFDEVDKMIRKIINVNACNNVSFIAENEKKYLEKSIQKVVSYNTLNKGQLLAEQDVIFRRTNKEGLDFGTITSMQKNFYMLDRDIASVETFQISDFKKARIAVIVAGRMKSSRLKQKAILPISDIPSVERCLLSCTKFKNADEIILATSTLEEDLVLKDYTLNGRVKFWTGDPDDVIQRYLGACEKYNIDVVIRVTADCPVVSSEIAEVLLKSHFETGADYSGVELAAVGSFCEIFNVEALKRVISYLGRAEYSEYMTWYMRNNSEIFKVNIVKLPENLIRDYRLTLDYNEDLEMFNSLIKKLDELKLEHNLLNIFSVLDNYPEIATINNHLSVKYKTDQELIDKLNKETKIHL